ncbi:MAG: sigma-70 family RNA polymerase sigma factor [Pseudomonadales bacterium]|nr:sigma-70 family RNA polymerase sigma factor [Pseudomonadales bacterium]
MDHAEAVLVSLAQHGDVDAFTEIVRRRQTSVRQLMYRLSGDASFAEDLAQQLFIKLWQNIHSLRDVQRFPGWLKKMAVNTFTSHVRKKQLPDASEPVETPTDFRDPTLVDDLSRALATLDESPRLCIVLAYLEGMTNEEISTATDLPLGTVKSHIRRGSEKLRSYLSSYDLDLESAHE